MPSTVRKQRRVNVALRLPSPFHAIQEPSPGNAVSTWGYLSTSVNMGKKIPPIQVHRLSLCESRSAKFGPQGLSPFLHIIGVQETDVEKHKTSQSFRAYKE